VANNSLFMSMVATELSVYENRWCEHGESTRKVWKLFRLAAQLSWRLTHSSTLHIKIPWFRTPIDYDVRAKPRNVASLTGTKRLANGQHHLSFLSRPRIDALPQIYRTLGTDYDERVCRRLSMRS